MKLWCEPAWSDVAENCQHESSRGKEFSITTTCASTTVVDALIGVTAHAKLGGEKHVGELSAAARFQEFLPV